VSGELQSQAVVRFSDGAGGKIPLQIIGDTGVWADTDIHLLLLPDVNATLKTNVGRATLGNSKVLDIAGGVIEISGSDVASLPFIPSVPPSLTSLFAFDSEGNDLGSVAAWYDPVTFQVRLSHVCTGAIEFSQYKASARMIAYTPKVEAIGQGSKTTYGVIAARYQKSVVIHQVQLPTIERGEAVIELYKRYSYKVINADGQFEKPPGYPQTGTYPGKSMVLDVVGSREIQRVHEIGFINQNGRAWVYTPNVTILEPYVGDDYTPTISCQIAALSPEQYPANIIAIAQDFIRSKGLGCRDA